jgi:MYXO-CTERM domain-containing protein
VTPIAQNAKALTYAGVFATHPYPNGTVPPDWAYNKPQQLGKQFWQTEWSQENANGDTPDPTMTSALDMATHIHTNMVTTQMNAWNWWAIYISEDALVSQDKTGTRENPALIQPDDSLGRPYMFQRGYTLGNWAKFVRPGFKRLGTTDPSPTLLVEGYRDGCHVAVIAINTDANDVTQKFILSDAPGVTSVTPWVTSPNDKLTAKTAVPVSATDGSFSFTIPGKSVVTFVNWDASSYTPDPLSPDAAASCPAATGGTSGVDAGVGGAGQGGAGQGGAAAVGGTAASANPATKDDSGCGCRVGGTRESSRALGLAALLLAVLSLRRRRA